MTFDIDEHLDGLEVHPAARKLMRSDSEVLWRLDTGPLNSDAGHDAFAEFAEWRANHPNLSLADCMHWIISESFGVAYTPELLQAETVQQQLAQDDAGDLDFHQDVYVVDETVMATALAQLIHEGRVDEPAKATIRFAVERQLHRLVLERMFPDASPRAERARALREVTRLVDNASGRPPPTRKPRTRRKMQRPPPCPWPIGMILRRCLPTGRTVLLHLFGLTEQSPVFYVLDWNAPELPSPADLETLDAKPARNLWKFFVALPPMDSDDDLDGYRRGLERTLAPTGLSKPSNRSTVPSMLVGWESLDEHLERNWDWGESAH